MAGKRQLIVNYVPGEECRVAVVHGGKLDEFYSEKHSQISRVGNIYMGRVTNVEPAIQAAFVDFGLEENGFLHVSDLHPKYFPGTDDDATERVGKKTPRRERPPIQDALRRGMEIPVQVIKEGVGTKGPTLTSYLSIPGRYLVMMPQMDKVGVSRKVEDEEVRAKMKAILDALEPPDGFGFIVRTAGLDRTKTELKRDLAYLQRLWKDMEKRKKASAGKPRLLYAESDLLLRTLRDMLTSDTEQVIIDNESALKRAAAFMKIVAPRTLAKLVHYTGKTPVFHATGLEQQIRTMYTREVPLPSGGRLVIDQTEALVAIDVNSGKSRSAGDSEDNAFRTNIEAAEEIARQLRLRDLGGIVVNDLIDMRLTKHRREVEGRFEELFKADRARTSVAPISEFGILEMTRQRMRSSHESVHFHTCPTCDGRGLLQRAESVAADSLRELAAVLAHEKVERAELAVHPRVGGELLSAKRATLARLERTFGKRVDVRLTDALAMDRTNIYAYDSRGNDIDVTGLHPIKASGEYLKAYEEAGVTDVADGDGDADDWAIEPSREDRHAEGEEADPLAGSHPLEQPLSDEDLRSVADRGGGGGRVADRGRRDGPARDGRGDGRRGGRTDDRRDDRRDGDRDGPAFEGPGRDADRGPDGAGGPEGPEGPVGPRDGDDEGGEVGGRRRRRRRRGRGRGRGEEGFHEGEGRGDEPRDGTREIELKPGEGRARSLVAGAIPNDRDGEGRGPGEEPEDGADAPSEAAARAGQRDVGARNAGDGGDGGDGRDAVGDGGRAGRAGRAGRDEGDDGEDRDDDGPDGPSSEGPGGDDRAGSGLSGEGPDGERRGRRRRRRGRRGRRGRGGAGDGPDGGYGDGAGAGPRDLPPRDLPPRDVGAGEVGVRDAGPRVPRGGRPAGPGPSDGPVRGRSDDGPRDVRREFADRGPMRRDEARDGPRGRGDRGDGGRGERDGRGRGAGQGPVPERGGRGGERAERGGRGDRAALSSPAGTNSGASAGAGTGNGGQAGSSGGGGAGGVEGGTSSGGGKPRLLYSFNRRLKPGQAPVRRDD